MHDDAVGLLRVDEGEGVWRGLVEWIYWAGKLDYPKDGIDSALRTALENGLEKGMNLIRENKRTL